MYYHANLIVVMLTNASLEQYENINWCVSGVGSTVCLVDEMTLGHTYKLQYYYIWMLTCIHTYNPMNTISFACHHIKCWSVMM